MGYTIEQAEAFNELCIKRENKRDARMMSLLRVVQHAEYKDFKTLVDELDK